MIRSYLCGLACLIATTQSLALDQKATDNLIKQVDDRQQNFGDVEMTVAIQQEEKGNKDPKKFAAKVFRRAENQLWLICFLLPSSEEGNGYLRIGKHLQFYDRSIGRSGRQDAWRHTIERSKLLGTGSRREDFDESRLSKDYQATYLREDKIKDRKMHIVKLKATTEEAVNPILHLWIDQTTGNLTKREEFALSDKKMRTIYYKGWNKTYSPSKKGDVLMPETITIFDDVEVDNVTTIKILKTSFEKLPDNTFTKAYLEKMRT